MYYIHNIYLLFRPCLYTIHCNNIIWIFISCDKTKIITYYLPIVFIIVYLIKLKINCWINSLKMATWIIFRLFVLWWVCYIYIYVCIYILEHFMLILIESANHISNDVDFKSHTHKRRRRTTRIYKLLLWGSCFYIL